MDLHYMTQEGYDKLKQRLSLLVTEKRRECQRELETARSFGDLSENAEYDAAKEKLNNNEREIRELSGKLSGARVLDDSKIAKDKAFIGAIVKLKDLADGEEVEYALVSSLEANLDENKISVASPLGKALLGHGIGDAVEMKMPNGNTMKYKILGIRR
jgi:transcription elongation factor GreA